MPSHFLEQIRMGSECDGLGERQFADDVGEALRFGDCSLRILSVVIGRLEVHELPLQLLQLVDEATGGPAGDVATFWDEHLLSWTAGRLGWLQFRMSSIEWREDARVKDREERATLGLERVRRALIEVGDETTKLSQVLDHEDRGAPADMRAPAGRGGRRVPRRTLAWICGGRRRVSLGRRDEDQSGEHWQK